MDMEAKDANGYMNKPLVSLDDQRVEGHENGGDDSETNSLLQRRGGISRKSDKARRKVQWNDRNGNKLAEVLEFLPRYSFC